jgi:hypothetical protein
MYIKFNKNLIDGFIYFSVILLAIFLSNSIYAIGFKLVKMGNLIDLFLLIPYAISFKGKQPTKSKVAK